MYKGGAPKPPIRMGKTRRKVLTWIRRKGTDEKFLLDELVEGIGLNPNDYRERMTTYNCVRGIREAILKNYLYYTLWEPDLLKHMDNEEQFYNKVIEYIHSFGFYLLICDDNHFYFEPTFDDLRDYQNKRMLQEWKVFYNRVVRSSTLRAELPSEMPPEELIARIKGIEEVYLMPKVEVLPEKTGKIRKKHGFEPRECPKCHNGIVVGISRNKTQCTRCHKTFNKSQFE